MILRWMLTITALAMLAACQTGTGVGDRTNRIGDGPIELSDKARAMFRTYLDEIVPMAFAVTQDGLTAAYTSCPIDNNLFCRRFVEMDIIFLCEEKNGKPCYIYALGRDVVWGTASARRPGTPNPPGAALPHINGTSGRTVSAVWGGEAGSGIAHIDPDQPAVRLEIVAVGQGACLGEIVLTPSREAGSWGVICHDNRTATGAVRLEFGSTRLLGEGRDSKGQPVRFTVHPDM